MGINIHPPYTRGSSSTYYFPLFIKTSRISFLVIIFLFYYLIGECQIFLGNPGFENHSKFSQYAKPHESNFGYLSNWNVIGLEVCNYCNTELEQKKAKNYKSCANSIIPHSGQGMVKMMYLESCPDISKITGCASYIQANLQTPLIVGNIYEISMWVYFPSTPSIDSSILSNIGFYLALYQDDLDVHELFQTEYFFSDSIQLDKWIEIKKYIRALCPLKYITLGPFKDSNFPVLHRPIDIQSIYYLDDISIRQINEQEAHTNLTVTPYCNYYEKQRKTNILSNNSEFNIFFNSNISTLSKIDSIFLDSTFKYISLNKSSVLVLSGHTDSTGNENMALSHKRIETIKAYIRNRYYLSELNFICFPMGSSLPKSTNKTIQGRALNRRVSVQLTNLNPTSVIYRNALKHLSDKEINLAVKEFRKWILYAPPEQKIMLLFDSRLKSLKYTASWNFLTNEIRDTYTSYSSKFNSFYLDSLYFEDQKYRTFDPYTISGFFPEYEVKDNIYPSLEIKDYSYLDSINLICIKKYLINNEFPKISAVGRRAVRGITNIIIHSNDYNMLTKYLDVIHTNCNLGEADWDSYAMMKDKIQIHTNQPQLFGTQKMFKDAFTRQLVLYPIDNIDSVNMRRVKIGMNAIKIE